MQGALGSALHLDLHRGSRTSSERFMRYAFVGVLIVVMGLMAGCRVFISDTRLRGPVPDPAVLATQEAERAIATATAEAPPSEEEVNNRSIIDDLVEMIGDDLKANNSFSGRETPKTGPLRGMRVEQGDTIRISSGRSQETAVEAEEYCVDQKTRCSNLWVYGRPGGRPKGAWYPLVIFEYALGE